MRQKGQQTSSHIKRERGQRRFDFTEKIKAQGIPILIMTRHSESDASLQDHNSLSTC